MKSVKPKRLGLVHARLFVQALLLLSLNTTAWAKYIDIAPKALTPYWEYIGTDAIGRPMYRVTLESRNYFTDFSLKIKFRRTPLPGHF